MPEGDVAVPEAVALLAAGRAIRPVWCNEVGCVTFQLGEGAARHFVKWVPAAAGLDLGAEAERMRWAVAFTAVPVVIDLGYCDSGSWLLTEGLPGENAVTDRWKRAPATAVRAVGEGLRAFHDALPVESCPFPWSAERRVEDARRRARAGLMDRREWHDSHQHLTIDAALALVAEPPPIDQLVVCHGDTCAPNTLIGDDGRWTGHVDLGALGVADRWADLAIATWSTTWNYGTGWEDVLLRHYGIEPDPHRTRYYRLLWDLGP